MKRFVVVIIAMVYFAVSSGFTLHMHYCMGHFVNTTFVDDGQDEHDCSHCGMKKKKNGNGCCKDEHKIVKSDKDHTLNEEVKAPVHVESTYLLPAHYTNPGHTFFTAVATTVSFNAHAPPDIVPLPVYLQIRNLRI